MAKLFLLLLLIGVTSVVSYTYRTTGHRNNGLHSDVNFVSGEAELSRLKKQADKIKTYALRRGYSTSYCIFADMELPSGRNRFFVYNLDKDSIVLSGLVAHGSCNSSYLEKAWFSNEPGCGCSSSGMYKVGGSYTGRFGKAFKLYGLDSTNSNAYKRSIVLHSYPQVPDHEIYPDALGNSLGCPMVAPGVLKQTTGIIEHSKKPVLLWVF